MVFIIKRPDSENFVLSGQFFVCFNLSRKFLSSKSQRPKNYRLINHIQNRFLFPSKKMTEKQSASIEATKHKDFYCGTEKRPGSTRFQSGRQESHEKQPEFLVKPYSKK